MKASNSVEGLAAEKEIGCFVKSSLLGDVNRAVKGPGWRDGNHSALREIGIRKSPHAFPEPLRFRFAVRVGKGEDCSGCEFGAGISRSSGTPGVPELQDPRREG